MAAPAKEQTSPPWNPPDHWDDVDKLGDAIPMGTSAGTLAKLVAARVPLDAKYTTPEGEQWTPSHLLEECQARKLAVNMVIDLTNTFKYYDGIAEFQAKGVEYVKIKVEGFADVPKEDIVQRFITVLSTWEHKLKQRKTEVVSEDEMTPVVIVHCTHGLNRTGYLVARYLIATRGISVKEALATFTAARPPGLIKHMYVKTLYNMFDQGGDIVLPTLPHWALHKYDRSKNELAAANNMPRIASTQPFDRKQHRLNESNLRRPPANWTDPPRMGDVVADSPFLPMRTLLDDSFDHGADPWTPDVFVAEQALRGHDVRLVVDLTNTTKYYNGPSAFAIHGIQYEKFALEGFSAAPSTASVAAFLDLVDAFEKTHPNAGHLALHCTHGLNRTGYLVACYLITRKNYSVQAALDAFATARPPGLIKFLYIDALHRMYSHGISTDNIKYPALPPWASKKYAKRATPPQSRTSTRRLWPPPSHWATTLPHGNWITVRRSEDVPIPVDAASATDALGGAHGTRTHKQAIEPTMRTLHLLPMKAMLDDRFDSDGSWTPHSFVSFVESGGGGPVHGVVSFCERNAYYTDDHLPSTLRRTYLPIRSGHVPHQSDVDAFYRVLDLWHGEVGRDMDLRVALHCSVGSRTGFYAIQCLVDFAHHTVDEAKAIYEAAWPPGFITKSFLKNLYFVERKNQMRLETTREDDACLDRRHDKRSRDRSRSRERLRDGSLPRKQTQARYDHGSDPARDSISRPYRRGEHITRSRWRSQENVDQSRAESYRRSSERRYKDRHDRQHTQRRSEERGDSSRRRRGCNRSQDREPSRWDRGREQSPGWDRGDWLNHRQDVHFHPYDHCNYPNPAPSPNYDVYHGPMPPPHPTDDYHNSTTTPAPHAAWSNVSNALYYPSGPTSSSLLHPPA